MKKVSFPLFLCLIAFFAYSVQAAFIVEPYSDGRGYSNFSGTPNYSTTKGTAPGLMGTKSAFGSTAAFPDVYTFSYTPGINADNWDPAAYTYFGNGFSTTDLVGGQTGYYNVYITWPATTGMTTTCSTAVAYDGGVATLTGLNMNTGGTKTLAQTINPDPPGTAYDNLDNYVGATNAWLRIATEVLLTQNQTYTVTQTASADGYTSMRSAGVMWEFVRTPEPATLVLLGLGSLLLRKRSN
jgi:hypothetical protein